MQLVQRHIIQMNHPYHQEIDFLCLLLKNLYNDTNFPVDKSFIVQAKYCNCNFLNKHLKYLSTYAALLAKSKIELLLYLNWNWLKFLLEIPSYKKKSHKFLSRFKLTFYKNQKNSKKDILLYEAHRMSQLNMTTRLIHLSAKNILAIARISSDQDKFYLHQPQTIAKSHYCMVEVFYEQKVSEDGLKKNAMAVIDLRMDNLAKFDFYKPGWIKVWETKQIIKSVHGYCHQQPVRFKILVTTYQTVIKQLQRMRTKLYRINGSLLIHADISGSLNIFIVRKLFSIALS